MSEEFKEVHAGSPVDESSVGKHFRGEEAPAQGFKEWKRTNAPFVEEIRAILMRPEVREELMHGVWAPYDDIPRLYAKCIDWWLDEKLFDWDWMPLQSMVAGLAREEAKEKSKC